MTKDTMQTLSLTDIADKARNVVQFTKEEFEAVLPVSLAGPDGLGKPLWIYIGLVMDEHTYAVPVLGTNKRVMIRSSVKANGKSAPSGEDSIRLWLEYYYTNIEKWISMGKSTRTTRIPGWGDRMKTKIRELWQIALDDSKGRNVQESAPQHDGAKHDMAWQDESEKVAHLVESVPSTLLSDQPVTTSVMPESEPEPLVIKYDREPNPEQRAAIEAPIDQAVRVLAPPGAGKTLVLSYRYAHLLANGISPGEILAVTFNKKMATELFDRIAKVTPSVRGTQAERQVCTIHAACYRMLKEVGLAKPNVANGYKIKRPLEDLALEYWPLSDKRPAWAEIYSWINMAKSRCLANTQDTDFYKSNLGEENGRILHQIRLKFALKLGDEGLWTYPDMLYLTEMELKTNQEFREKFQRRFKWIMVDEGQDTNGQAMRILTTLAKPQNQFFMCADADQLLYRFTGATPEVNVYHGFESKFPSALTIKLRVNYRSTVQIIQAAQSLINHNYGPGNRYDADYRKEMVARPDAPEGSPISFNFYANAADEADALVSSLVAEVTNRPPDDIFVGARTRAQLGYLEGGLVRAKVPFINATGGSFWMLKHVSELVSYLKLSVNLEDKDAFARVYNVPSNLMTVPWKRASNYGEYCPHRYLGRAFLQASNGTLKGIRKAMDYRGSFRPGSEDFLSFMGDLAYELNVSDDPQHMLHIIREECYNKYLLASEGITDANAGDTSRFDDLDAVLDIAGQFKTIEEFLSYVVAAEAAAEASKDKSWKNHVVISTVHRLKGLEREVVYGVGFSEGVDGFSGLLPHTFSLVAPPKTGALPMGGKGLVEDERCIAYVLCTRAKSEIHLSGVSKYRGKKMMVSRFMVEMENSG